MNPEIHSAMDCYRWLWRSPLLTVPTVSVLGSIILTLNGRLSCSPDCPNSTLRLAHMVGYSVAILGSGMWHLTLLRAATHRQSAFVRWHGRQALILAGVRTAIPLGFFFADFFAQEYAYPDLYLISAVFGAWMFGEIPYGILDVILALVAVWLFGTGWGQQQAARGDCALMHWTGQGAGLPLAVTASTTTPTPPSPAGE